MLFGKQYTVMGMCLALTAGSLGLSACEDDGAMKVQRISPVAGHLAGDQPVRIEGRNFRTDIGYTVYFGNKKSKSLTIRSPELLEVITPKSPTGKPGPVDVSITADDGTAFKIPAGFRYEDMSGSVVEGLGSSGGKKSGNLAF